MARRLLLCGPSGRRINVRRWVHSTKANAMSSLASQGLPARPIRHRVHTPTIVVVDPQSADFDAWKTDAESSGAHLQVVASASEALRIARTAIVDLWVINSELDGIGGCDLCGLVR